MYNCGCRGAINPSKAERWVITIFAKGRSPETKTYYETEHLIFNLIKNILSNKELERMEIKCKGVRLQKDDINQTII